MLGAMSLLNEKHTQEQLDTLARCANGIPSPFVCSGELDATIALRFRDGTRVTLDPHAYNTSQALIARCERATFGDGPRTRRDRRVRDALQCNAAGGAFTVEGFDPSASGLLETVRAALAPNDPNPLTAELYAVNIYRDNGHFIAHKDTPRGDDMLGTLVLGVSRDFRGGELVLSGDNGEVRYVWDPPYRNTGHKVPWVAFFGDVDHEVRTVYGGDRVTLTWLLRRGAGAPVSAPEPGGPAAIFARQLAKTLHDSRFVPHGGTLGFACQHMYSEVPGFKRAIPPLDERSVLRLKGRDQSVAAAALGLGLKVHLAPYVIEEGCWLRWQLSRFLSEREKGVFDVDQLDTYEMESRLPVKADCDNDKVVWAIDPAQRPRTPASAKAHEYMGEMEFSTTGYFGNEGCDGSFYLDAAILIELPPPSARTRLLAKREKAERPKPPTSARPPKASAAKPDVTAAQLREMGYTPAKVKALLAEGALVRTGFGWYRFTRGER